MVVGDRKAETVAQESNKTSEMHGAKRTTGQPHKKNSWFAKRSYFAGTKRSKTQVTGDVGLEL